MDQLWKTKSQGDMCPTTYKGKLVFKSMIVSPVIEEEAWTIIKTLDDGSVGWVAIYVRIVKATCQCFITPSTHILNI